MTSEPRLIPALRARRLPVVGWIAAVIVLGALVARPATCAGAEARPEREGRPLVQLTGADAWFGVGALVAVGAAAFADLGMRDRALASSGDGARHLARAVQPLGRPEVLGSTILVGYLAGRALDRPGLAAASARVGIPVAVAAVATGGLKLAIGRVRPEDSAAESDPYQPFSGHASFPSGHSSLAFATATALDRETEAGWVPWVVYPIAGLVAWSRVHDDKHWTSDVVAGAALGAWTAAKTHDVLRERDRRAGRLGLGFGSGPGATRAGVQLSF